MFDAPPHINAVLSALQFEGARVERLRTLTDGEWNDLLLRWDFHRCMIPLRQTCEEALPEWVRLEVDQRLADNAERLERIKADYSTFANASHSIGADHLVIKGFSLWPGFVDHPRFRSQSDIDLYCPPESILLARDVLIHLGYEPETEEFFRFADHLPTMTSRKTWKWRGKYCDPEIPASFELHFSFWNEKVLRIRPKGLDQFWARRKERRLDDISFPSLNELDNFGYASLNLTRNLLRDQPSPYQIYELARFLHIYADHAQFWDDWYAAHGQSIRQLEAISCYAAAHCFSCQVPEQLRREFAGLPEKTKAWFGKFNRLSLSQEIRPRKDWLWLHISLVESAKDRAWIIGDRLLPAWIPPLKTVDRRDATIDEQQKKPSLLGRQTKYLGYVTSRLSYHLRLIPSTLWRGADFWWSTQNLGRHFWNFFTVSFLYDLGMFVFFFLYNLYLLDRGFRESFIGLVASANTIGAVASCLPSGVLAQRAGLRKSLFICMASVAAISGTLALVTSRPAILVLSFLLGAASTIWAVAIAPATTRLTNDKNREIGFSLIFSSGIAVGLLGSTIASRMPGWLAHINPSIAAIHAKQVTLLIGSVVVATAAWPAFCLRFTPSPIPEKRTYPRNPFLLRFLPVIAVWSLAAGAFTPFHTVYFSQYLHLRLERIGIVTSISQITQALAILAAPFFVKRYGLVSGIVYMQLATAISLGWLASAHAVPTAMAFYIAYTALQWMSEPAIFSLLMSQVPASEQAGASALNFLVMSVVQAFAAAAAGASFVRFGYPAVLGATAVVALLAAILFRSALGEKAVKVTQTVTDSVGLH
jgi:MFS family permease